MTSPAPARTPRHSRGDPQTAPPVLRPAEWAEPGDEPEPRRQRRRHPVLGVTVTAIIAGSFLAAIFPVHLTLVAGLITWAILVAVAACAAEWARRRLLPRAGDRWRAVFSREEPPARQRRGRAATQPVRTWDEQAAGSYDDDGYAEVPASVDRGWTAARPRGAGSAGVAGPGGRRTAQRARAALAARQFVAPKTGIAPSAEAVAWSEKIGQFRSDDGDALEEYLDQLAADFYHVGAALADMHEGLVNDTDLDEIPCAAVHDVADEVVEVGGSVLSAKDRILTYYEDPRTFAAEGGKMPKNQGDFWEQH